MRALFTIQGAFYFLTGVWPILHMQSFIAVTGPKTDIWLVKTVGAMIGVSGFFFFRERKSPEPSINLVFLAMGQALVLATVDIYYSSIRVISSIYLADAVAEILLFVLWTMTLLKRFRNTR